MAYKSTLTNNFSANLLIFSISVVGVGIWAYIDSRSLAEAFPMIRGWRDAALHLGTFATTYLLASYWFSPDLDVRTFRPGKHSFPFGPLFKIFFSGGVGRLKVKRRFRFIAPILDLLKLILAPIHILINGIWNIFWQPFAELFTHRGVVHWPVLGTHLKMFYLYVVYFLVGSVVQIIGLDALPFLGDGFWLGFFGRDGVCSVLWHDSYGRVFYIAWMIADTCHSAVDLWDSVKEGKKFVPPALIAPRGVFAKIIGHIKSQFT